MASPRPSRYHSQREKHRSDEMQSPPSSPPEDSQNAVTRSKSRYHRKPGAAERASDQRPTSQQQQGELPSRYHSKRQSPMNTLYQEQVVQSPPRAHRRTSSSGNNNGREITPPAGLGAVDERSRAKDSAHRSPPVSPPEGGPTGELFPPPMPVEQPVRRDGPPQSGQIRATKSMSELPVMDDEHAGCFGGIFRRKQAAPNGADTRKPMERPKTAKDGPQTIRPGGGGIVPGIDAPISASNAGDRQVMVECGSSKRLFAVTPETTSVDILKSAATCMSERIDVKSALLLEYFGTVGVQRPIRRYEHIREVMNSWDSDRQNSLVVIDPGTGSVEPELTITGVPKEKPGDQSFWLSYSQKVGKWDKRYVVLRSDGQLVHMKNPDKAKDTENICHMSDFDIYTPTPDKQKKKIKPPKKLCYAIKSQQKTSMFESTSDFVHFFSTGDRATGDAFYNAIQSYRSWYLVHVLEAGRKEKPKPAANESRHRAPSNDQHRSHRPQESMDSHYQLGSFKPLIDMDQFERRPGSSGSQDDPGPSSNQFDPKLVPERRASKRQHPPPALNNRAILADDEPLANLTRKTSVSKRTPSGDQKDFKDSGLLGRKYSQRRQEHAERESREQQAFTAGPSLLNGGASESGSDGLQRQLSTRRHASNSEVKRTGSSRDTNRGHQHNGSSGLDRSHSQRQKPKPLVDLTPEYKEPPHHTQKGRGYKPERISAGGLIKSATSPEDPLGIPSHTVFRKDKEQYMPPPSPHSPGLVDLTPQHREPVHHSRKGRGFTPETGHAGGLVMNASTPEDPLGIPQNNVFRSVNAMPEGRQREVSGSDQNQLPRRQLSVKQKPEGFTGEGLLAAAANRQGWGGETKGRGVMDGSRAGGKPLVDLNEDNTFSQGSLLNKVQRAEGIPKPIIDREKRDD